MVIDPYRKKRVLVTGHTGFKGGWLSLWLTKLGARVTGYSLVPPSQPNFFDAVGLKERITHLTGDVRDEKRLLSVFKKAKPDLVFHMAAQSLVLASYREPRLTYETNTMGTVNVLEAARKNPSVKACIVVTSDKCYENRETLHSYKETDALGGYDPYSSSKASAELVTQAYRNSFFNPEKHGRSHNMALASVRAGNIIGGGDWGEDRILPDCVRALSKKESVAIRNPHAVRPWHYVLEPLWAYLLLGSLMCKDGKRYSEAWNFGPLDGNAVTVQEIVRLALKFWGGGKYRKDPSPQPHEATFLKLDIGKARKLLSWKPIYGVSSAVKRAVSWYRLFYDKATKGELLKCALDEIDEYTERIKTSSPWTGKKKKKN